MAPQIKKITKKSSIPSQLAPMLATRLEKPFNDPEYVYEIKWDGYRIIARIEDGKVKLLSRSLLDYTSRYAPIVDALKHFKRDVILDGEIIVTNDKGSPSFDALQAYNEGDPIFYYVFDILWLDGGSVLELPLVERKRILKKVAVKNNVIRYSEHFPDGIVLFEKAKNMGLEGIVAKRKESQYFPGTRSVDWLKIPTDLRQEFVIGGWTESDNKTRSFRSLLFGYYQDGKLVYVGHAGGGFKDREMPQMLARLKRLEIKKKPFENAVDTEHRVHWVKPLLVAEIKYATLTRSGKIRKPAIFLGFREDKNSLDVVREESGEKRNLKKSKKAINKESNWPILLAQHITSREEIEYGGCAITVTNIEKQLWKGVTKADLLMYYHNVSAFLLPHLKARPQSLHIKHNTPLAPGMYIKDMEGRQPECADIFTVERKHKKKGKRDNIDYLVCNNEATLLYLINLGCIDINPWTSRISNYLQPDFIIIDLDPSDKDFKKVIFTAQAAKEFLDRFKIKAFPKTSGKTGLHLYLPCAGYTYAEARSIAEKICGEINTLLPGITTTEVTINNRGNKLYLDPNQNDEADTVAAPYTVRPFRIPTVSTPLDWKEINDRLQPQDFTIATILKRLKKKGDLFRDVMSPAIAKANKKRLEFFL